MSGISKAGAEPDIMPDEASDEAAFDGASPSGDESPGRPSGRPGDSAAVLRLAGVSVRFGGIAALTDVSMEVPAGSVCGLIGPNGAGKTTLFDVVSGVRRPRTGRVFFDGRDITRVNAVKRARLGLRRTFQRVQTFGWLSVEDNLLAALEWEGGGGGILGDMVASPSRTRRERKRRERVDEIIERCGLGAVRRDSAGSLPIGVARMVELGRALVARPKLVMLDEPTSGLGDAERDLLGAMISGAGLGEDCSVLLVEHDVGFVMQHCDLIYVLSLGRVLAAGLPHEIQANPDVRAAYLGSS